MKRLHEVIKPFLAIILGALLFLMYLNLLQPDGGPYLAIGILAVVFAVHYIALGVVDLLLGKHLPRIPRHIFEVAAVVIFPIFMFVYFLLTFIGYADMLAQMEEKIGVAAVILFILKIQAPIGFIGFFAVASFVKRKWLERMALLFSALFVLALLLEILFNISGNPVGLGAIVVVEFALYFIYCNILFTNLPFGKGEPAPAAEPEAEEPEEEAAPEEEPEEAPAEE